MTASICTLGRCQALLWFTCILAVGCQPTGKDQMELTQTLTLAAERVAPGQTLSLDTAAVLPWDQVILVGPYTPHELIQKAVGGLPEALQRIEIDKRDDVNAIVFMLDGRATTAVALTRRVADFRKVDMLRPISRKQAHFVRAESGVEFSWRGP